MRRLTAVAGLALALSLSACGSSSGAGSTSEAATTTTATTVAKTEAAPTSTAASSGGASGSAVKTVAEAKARMAADSGLNETQSGCIVDKLVASVGETKALALVSDDRDLTEMPADDAKAAGAAVAACVSKADFAKVIADSLLDEMGDAGVTRAQADCVGTKLVEIIDPQALLTGGSGELGLDSMDPAQQGKLFQVLTDCLPPEVLGKMAGAVDEAPAGAGATTTAKP